MVGGDFSFEDVFSLSDNNNNLAIPYFIWIIFIVIVPVLLSNMLVRNSMYRPL